MPDIETKSQNFTQLIDKTAQGIKIKMGADYKDQDLSNHGFYDCVFGKSNFSNANLYNTVFSGSNLSESIFFRSKTNGTDFRNTDIRPEQLIDAIGVESALFDNKDRMLKEIEKIKLSYNIEKSKIWKFIMDMIGDSKLSKQEQTSVNKYDEKSKNELKPGLSIYITEPSRISKNIITPGSKDSRGR